MYVGYPAKQAVCSLVPRFCNCAEFGLSCYGQSRLSFESCGQKHGILGMKQRVPTSIVTIARDQVIAKAAAASDPLEK